MKTSEMRTLTVMIYDSKYYIASEPSYKGHIAIHIETDSCSQMGENVSIILPSN